MRATFEWLNSDIAFTVVCDCGAEYRATGIGLRGVYCPGCEKTFALPDSVDLTTASRPIPLAAIFDPQNPERDINMMLGYRERQLRQLLTDIYVAVLPYVVVDDKDWVTLEAVLEDNLDPKPGGARMRFVLPWPRHTSEKKNPKAKKK